MQLSGKRKNDLSGRPVFRVEYDTKKPVVVVDGPQSSLIEIIATEEAG